MKKHWKITTSHVDQAASKKLAVIAGLMAFLLARSMWCEDPMGMGEAEWA